MAQDASKSQFDVCSDGAQVALDSGFLGGSSLISSFLSGFKSDLPDFVAPIRDVPEPMGLAPFRAGPPGLSIAGSRRR